MVPNLVNSKGDMTGQQVTWDGTGPEYGVPLVQQEQWNLEAARRYIQKSYADFIRASWRQQ